MGMTLRVMGPYRSSLAHDRRRPWAVTLRRDRRAVTFKFGNELDARVFARGVQEGDLERAELALDPGYHDLEALHEMRPEPLNQTTYG
jgi:hypothetical protein